MASYAKKTIATLFAGTVLAVGVAAPASAQTTVQDGLINVGVTTGDITVTDTVDIGVAAQIAANVCGVKVGPVAVLGVAVDRDSDTDVVCRTADQTVTFSQN